MPLYDARVFLELSLEISLKKPSADFILTSAQCRTALAYSRFQHGVTQSGQ